MLCKVPVHSFKVNYNIVRSIKDYIENRTTLKLAETLERIWRLHIFNQKGEASASSFFCAYSWENAYFGCKCVYGTV